MDNTTYTYPLSSSGWRANLSNGETVMETPSLPGEPMAWRKLINRCAAEGLYLTGLSLVHGPFRIFALPQKACDGYYHAFDVHKSLFTGREQFKQGIGSVVGDKVFIAWMDENGAVSIDIRDIKDCLPHIILRGNNEPVQDS